MDVVAIVAIVDIAIGMSDGGKERWDVGRLGVTFLFHSWHVIIICYVFCICGDDPTLSPTQCVRCACRDVARTAKGRSTPPITIDRCISRQPFRFIRCIFDWWQNNNKAIQIVSLQRVVRSHCCDLCAPPWRWQCRGHIAFPFHNTTNNNNNLLLGIQMCALRCCWLPTLVPVPVLLQHTLIIKNHINLIRFFSFIIITYLCAIAARICEYIPCAKNCARCERIRINADYRPVHIGGIAATSGAIVRECVCVCV